MKRVLSSLSILLIALSAAGQSGEIIPPSPNVATLQRFGDYPVDLSTGLVNISIPLYEIKLRDYTYPIAIRFHASGRRWSGGYSSMGVGWSLDATGFVSREIRERPDEDYVALEMTADSITNRNTSNIELAYDRLVNADMSVPNGYLTENGNTESSKEDSEHDMFTYSANGLSGKFVVDKWNNAFPLTYTNAKIMFEAGHYGGTITDEQGTLYTFGMTEGTNQNSVETVWNTTRFGSRSFVTGMFLSRIDRPSGENINFIYGRTQTDNTETNVVDRFRYVGVTNGVPSGPFGGIPGECIECIDFEANYLGPRTKDLPLGGSYDITYPKEITFPNGKVIFDYNEYLMLTGFHILDGSNQVVRSGSFTYITTPGTHANTGLAASNSRSLDKLVIKNNDGGQEQVYSFNYYDDTLPMSVVAYPTPNTDWWGYCNSTGENGPPYDPAVEITLAGCVNQIHKASKLTSTRSGMLRRIHFPTGGSTEFSYELNQYNDGNVAPRNGPGLRIQKVVSDDGTGINKITKLYKYGQNEDGKGILYKHPNAMDFKYQQRHHVYTYTDVNGGASGYVGYYTLTTYSPSPVTAMSEAYQQPVYYDKVFEYTVSENGDKNGRTEYTYTLPQYLYTGAAFRKKEWTTPQLIGKSTYSTNPAGTSTVEFTSYTYSDFRYRKLPQVRIWRNSFLRWDDSKSYRPYERSRVLNGEQVISYYDFPYESAVKKPTSMSHTIDGVTTTTEYFYDDPNYLLPTRVVNTSSTGELISEETRYVFNFYQAASGSMLAKNWLFPVERSTYRMNGDGTGKRLISTELTTWSESMGVPLKIYRIDVTSPLTNFIPAYTQAQSPTIIKDSRYLEKHSFDLYGSKGNLLQEHKPDDIYTSYLWDASAAYPIAQVKGATFSQISSLNGKPANYSSISLGNSLQALSPAAIIQTYSYNPLIGVASQTDTNGRTTYYGYDGLGRLETIKDHDLNIVKKFTYHYKQP